ncbi:hypothetical protein AcV7_004829 [Taiwanofungus camphoratus]|nr:hypothetical protein AcV7_004829 [Antrodia cinnamomea]
MTSYDNDPFYLRYYTGHSGKHGHEFLEFEYSHGRLRYANNSNYRNDSLIRKEMWVGPLVVKELKRIVESSEITKEDDTNWPKKNIVGKQELEIRVGNDHIAFEVCHANRTSSMSNNVSRLRKSAPWSTSKTVKTLKDCEFSITSFRI